MSDFVSMLFFFFFFQAEDGIRDLYVTGVQTCALPILPSPFGHEFCGVDVATGRRVVAANSAPCGACDACRRGEVCVNLRSEERRVGKECRSRWSAYRYKREEGVVVWEVVRGSE